VGVDGAILGFITSVALGAIGLEVEGYFVDPDYMRRRIA